MATAATAGQSATTIADVVASADILARKLRFCLQMRGMSQTELARRIGINRQSLNHYFQGAAPKPDVLLRMAKVLDVDLEWLCDESDPSLDPSERKPRLTDAEHKPFVEEMRRRYIWNARVIEFVTGIDLGRPRDINAAAAWLLCNQEKRALPDAVVQRIREVNDILERHHYLAFYAGAFPDGKVLVTPDDLDPYFDDDSTAKLAERLDYKRLTDAFASMLEGEPGFNAIEEYALLYGFKAEAARRSSHREQDARREKVFWSHRAPYWLARLLTNYDLGRVALFDPVRAALRERGFIDASGEPTDRGEGSIFYLAHDRAVAESEEPLQGEAIEAIRELDYDEYLKRLLDEAD